VFPGGFGTLDELFEVVTLDQTGKLSKPIKVVLYGSDYWQNVLNFDALVEYGTIDRQDLDKIFVTDTVDGAFDFITRKLLDTALDDPGGVL
jgi:hypothetical protein